LHSRLQPSAIEWVTGQARLEAQRSAPDVAALEGAIRTRFQGAGGGAGSDIDALVLMVLMEATSDQEQDLQATMAQVQAQTAAKQQMRVLMQELQQQMALMGSQGPNTLCHTPICTTLEQQVSAVATTARQAGRPLRAALSEPLTYVHLSAFESGLGSDLAGMNEMSEMSSTQLQMAMDRRSKFIDTLSNVLKKIGDTDDAVVQNLK
jgi:hypothetical protein